MSRITLSTPIPLALAVALAVGSGSAVWAQGDPSFNLLVGSHEPIELGPLPGEGGQIYLRFEPATGTLKLNAQDALLCFDYSGAVPAPQLRAGLTLPNGSTDVLHGITAAAISPGQGGDSNLVYLEPTETLDCRAFPESLLTQLELDKEASLAGATSKLFKSSFDRTEALPSLELEIIDRRSRTRSLPQRDEVVAYTIRVVPRDRRGNGAGTSNPVAVEDVRIRDYTPPVNTNGQPLALSPAATITRCSYNGAEQINPETQLPACMIDETGALRFALFPGLPGATLNLDADVAVEFDIERTVIGSVGTPPGLVTVIAVASATPEPDNFGSLEDAYHVFTFS